MIAGLYVFAVSIGRDGIVVAVTTNAVEIVGEIDIATPGIQSPRILMLMFNPGVLLVVTVVLMTGKETI